MKVYFDRATDEFVGIDDALLGKLKRLYPGVDIQKELTKMSLWLKDNPNRKGAVTFIMSWLSRAPQTIQDEEVPQEYTQYLERLWQGRENLFLFNTKL